MEFVAGGAIRRPQFFSGRNALRALAFRAPFDRFTGLQKLTSFGEGRNTRQDPEKQKLS
jgi:hypothetical protein